MSSERIATEDRLPVWEAFSEFFLDTELDESHYRRISQTLLSSPYSMEELEEILKFEVYPVLMWNLRSVAGEWAGFDRNWLLEVLEPKLNKRPKFRLPLLQWWMVKNHWEKVSALMARA